MPEGYQVDPSITAAITLFPSPTTHTELRSFVGLVNQMTSGTNTIAELITPFRPLLSSAGRYFSFLVEYGLVLKPTANRT